VLLQGLKTAFFDAAFFGLGLMAWSVVVAAVSALLASFGMFVESSLRVWRTTIHHFGRATKQVNSASQSDDGSAFSRCFLKGDSQP
jgi:hypothetical protein